MPGIHVKFEVSPEDFLAHLTEAAYRISLRHGIKGAFLQYKLDLQEALREVIRRDMFVTDLCGLMTVCQEASRLEPWSAAAERVYEEMVA